jgi:hypothetical protein
MNQRGFRWGFTNVLLLLVLILGGWWVVDNRQEIIDWWRLRTYTAPAEIARISDETDMTQRARELFYVSDPKIQDREAFNFNCETTPEHGRVLGCYAAQKIYLFNVTDQRLAGVLQVTAVHEMLHAAYERLDSSTRQKVDAMVRREADNLKNDKKLQDLLAIYEKTEPGELANELHSILATEYQTLPADLEEYYKQYFTQGRAKVIALQKAYNAEFDASKARIDAYQQQLDTLKPQIDANTADLKRRDAEIDAEKQRLDSLRATNVAEYNNEVPGFNAKAQDYNRIARNTQSLVAHYNDIVARVKNEVALQQDLNKSLDSQYTPVSTQ